MSKPPNYSFPRPLLLASQLQTYQQARSNDVDSDDSDSDMSLPEINEKQSCIEAEKRRFPYWICPVVCAFVWFGTSVLLFFLLWGVLGRVGRGGWGGVAEGEWKGG